MLTRPALIVFDLDGTLVDSLGDLQRALNLTLAEFHCGPLTLARVQSLVGDGVGQLVSRALEAAGCKADVHEALARYLAHYDADPVAHTQVYPGVRATLEAFRREGIALAVLTNKLSRSTQLVLERLELARYFSRVVSGDSLGFRKPDPRVLLAVLADFSAPAAESLMVGDSEVDADTARAAGVPFVQMTYGYHRTPLEQIPSARSSVILRRSAAWSPGARALTYDLMGLEDLDRPLERQRLDGVAVAGGGRRPEE